MTSTIQPATMRIGTWNTDRAVPSSARRIPVSTALAGPDCDILCVTEGSACLFTGEDHIIDAGTNWGISPPPEHLRKVLLWSRSRWTEEDFVGSPDFPGGRFVKGVTETPIGTLTVIGVCIPWKKANAAKGREHWEDHETWLKVFERLPWRSPTDRLVVLGDFNQQIPRDMRRVQAERKKALRHAFDPFVITTAGAPDVDKDHIAHTRDLKRISPIGIWPRRDSENQTMSDHVGVWADFGLTKGQHS